VISTPRAFDFVIWLLVGYACGSLATGYWLGKMRGIDIREHGSGNVGATNVFRVLGTPAGIFTLLVDILKGAIPVILALRASAGSLPLALTTGLGAILGHATSPFVKFRGGKGVATSAGVFFALMPYPFGVALGVFLVVFAVTRTVSASSIASAVGLAIASFFFQTPRILSFATMAVSTLVIWKHRSNIKRLIAGTEPRLGQRKIA
jgi:acyl phosphate:glycerol-3-phosphate acyltransferase